ncbi:TAT-variant-translocated molybdopterin oxidoreductase [Rufibacter glacialis]|uniref:4Fe-4S dicluster domain-containing protein n=1 Tax=Rufibacter glacialis TaxID=1259555 RepID=A0A5M8QKX9_9BACT|nr:TAT-variant-translocated molybdopterin oxidoreductase [Rufibacter glacialis]KAA6435878.1 4Fe-4S dicluster domain-containing protein [Rufibacter glacialis]GGK67320.1 quinol:cytochrome C oxidoreductase [Rufibacter glacialis]
MQETIKYWRGVEELENTPEFQKHAHNEFPEFLPVSEANGEASSATVAPRRDFLKLLGFGVAAATLASCEAPVRKAIPYLNKPEEVEPGIPNWYASTYFMGDFYNPVLVKTREGRPIKIEGNNLSPITQGATHARSQASLLSLYDNNRLKGPVAKKQPATWEKIDQEIRTRLTGVQGRVVLVSNTIISPSTKTVIREFGAQFPAFEHVTYDANSSSALLRANGGVVPGYDFSKARVIVSIGADFLGSWISPVEYSKQYIVNRKVTADKPTMSRHFQFESFLSLTGANADVRVPVKPSEYGAVVAALYNRVAGGTGGAAIQAPTTAYAKQIDTAAKELLASRGAALVVSDSNDPAVQTLVTAINTALGAAGTTINTAAPSFVRQGDDARMLRLINDMNNGAVGAVIFYGANPVYDHPLSQQVVNGLKKVGVKISFSDREDETAAHVDYICPDSHFLESWNDFEPKRGFLGLAQPTISPIFNTRQAQDSLLKWTGSTSDFYTVIQRTWSGIVGGGAAWDKVVHDGVATGTTGANEPTAPAAPLTLAAAAVSINNTSRTAGNNVELAIYEKVAIGSGIHANNPWLQEMSDPTTKATWDNYVTISSAMAKELGVEQNDILRVTAKGKSVELPALIQPGQAKGTVGIAIGYGRTHAGLAANNVGANVYPLVSVAGDSLVYANTVTVAKAGGDKPIAQTQTHHTVMGRIVVQENTLANYKKDPKSVTEYIRIATPDGPQKPQKVSLWQDFEYKNHHWGMVIDLNSCIGCGTCTISCQVENNVAVVGKQEVLNRREMHWLRIDRYYSTDATREDGGFEKMENPSENPNVIFQPMLCQHCNHAPCETVCPVAATMHSTEGLNQMVYNRCVGTRYCANNCPYKVRRFNWFNYANNEKFDYQMNNDLGKMVLNPDVTVRSRGVMEKCSFCVQRIQYGKLEAKKESRRPVDGEIVTACAQSCPTNAIIFGDMLDQNSQISQILKREQGERAFHVLEELNTQPNVTYLTKIRNQA